MFYQIGLVSVPRCKIEANVICPCGFTKPNVLEEFGWAGVEVPVEPKDKGCCPKSEANKVPKAAGMALDGTCIVHILANHFLPQEVHWVEHKGEGDDMEDHVINKVPEKVA